MNAITPAQEQELAEISSQAARGSKGRPKTKEEKAADEEFRKLFLEMFKTAAFNQLVNKSVDAVNKQQRKAGHGSFQHAAQVVGDQSDRLYGISSPVLKDTLIQICKENPQLSEVFSTVSSVMQGILYGLDVAAEIVAVVKAGIIEFNKYVIFPIVRGIWDVIKEVTGFLWDTFVKTIASPLFWATIAAAGAGIAIVNPIIGALVGTLGIIGTIASAILQ